ncbi:hypothetical protein SNE40_012072 [Patella caerulea]|uniref:Uncharacterized protein n=1 Tax=Patella caerulea TaxID=87958 RepID=A0AAN8JQR2_PATCE
MLPRVPGVKTCAFTRRVVAFNEPFASLGQTKTKVTALWHEAISGRNASDIASSFWNFFKQHIVIWVDNCTAQNNNWTFFSCLVSTNNSEDIDAETIQMKYLEAGHTFMLADSVHHQIECELKKYGDVRDWIEFMQVCKNAKCDVIEMKHSNFHDFIDASRRPKLTKTIPHVKLSEMAFMLFERGS